MTLKTNKSKSKNKAPGFTIVELLVVIVVIGILAAITIVSYTGITKKANESTLQSDLATAKKQFALYYTEHGVYPTGLDGNKCPTGTTNPSPDTNYCLKPSSGDNIEISEANGTKYKLTATKGTLSFSITEDSTPSVSVLLPESDWITIGTQRWARKNLNVGTRIDGALDQADNSILEKYCYDNLESNCDTYGGLYQWSEVMQYTTTESTQGLCPTGSHIPTDNEWKTLEMYLGMTQEDANLSGYWRGSNEGSKIRIGGSSGLGVLLAGYRFTDGSFNNLSFRTHLFSSSEDAAPTRVWIRLVDSSRTEVYRGTLDDKRVSFSVRCLGS